MKYHGEIYYLQNPVKLPLKYSAGDASNYV